MGSEVEQDAAAPPDGRAGDPVTEPLWRQFVEHTPAAVAMFDREMRYLLYSRRWLEDYGLGDRDITGLSHYEVFPEIPERWKELHRRALAGEVVRCDEDPFPRADGRLDWVRWELQPWRHPDGSIGGIIMFTEVITARKRMEDEVRRSREQYAELFKANPHPMWVYDLETLRFLDVNEAACQNYEYSRDEFLAMMITDILPREDVEHLLRRIEKGRGHRPGSVGSMAALQEGRLVDPGGDHFPSNDVRQPAGKAGACSRRDGAEACRGRPALHRQGKPCARLVARPRDHAGQPCPPGSADTGRLVHDLRGGGGRRPPPGRRRLCRPGECRSGAPPDVFPRSPARTVRAAAGVSAHRQASALRPGA